MDAGVVFLMDWSVVVYFPNASPDSLNVLQCQELHISLYYFPPSKWIDSKRTVVVETTFESCVTAETLSEETVRLVVSPTHKSQTQTQASMHDARTLVACLPDSSAVDRR